MIELIKNIGAILGYIATAIGLLAMVRTFVLSKTKEYVEEVADTEESGRIHTELDSRITNLEEKFSTFLERDTKFKDKMDSHIRTQQLVDRKLMKHRAKLLYRFIHFPHGYGQVSLLIFSIYCHNYFLGTDYTDFTDKLRLQY